MPIFKRNLKKNDHEIPQAEIKPFEQREKLQPLYAFFTIINREQANYYIHAYEEAGVAVTMVLYAHSQPPQEILSIIGPENTKKEILISVVRKDDMEKLKKIASERFKISKTSKGIAFACPIDSVGGISVYKFLADHNREIRGENHGK